MLLQSGCLPEDSTVWVTGNESSGRLAALEGELARAQRRGEQRKLARGDVELRLERFALDHARRDAGAGAVVSVFEDSAGSASSARFAFSGLTIFTPECPATAAREGTTNRRPVSSY